MSPYYSSILSVLSILCILYPSKVHSLGVPFHPIDALPLLPGQLSWPILNSFRSPLQLLPVLVGSANPHSDTTFWKGSCFERNRAWMVLDNKHGSPFGGGTLHIQVDKARRTSCMDAYLFVTPFRVTWDYFFLQREHTIEFEEWKGKAEFEFVKTMGVTIFRVDPGLVETLRKMWDIQRLFNNGTSGEQANIEFLQRHMRATFEKILKPWVVTSINPDDIHTGDLILISQFRGEWAGFETLRKWVTGAFAGQVAVCIKDDKGQVWVVESTQDDEKGEAFIEVIRWEEWWNNQLHKGHLQPNIAILPLHRYMRARINETAVWNYVTELSGKPCGLHNMLFNWIDTLHANYPPPLNSQLIAPIMHVWHQIMPSQKSDMFIEALNKRLGTQKLSLRQVINEVTSRGSTFGQLLTIPENDNWIYSTGKAVFTSCLTFHLGLYKVAGLFDPIADKIQVTEFTIKDIYSLKFFENNSSRLPRWCNNGGLVMDVPFCQILGDYKMELPGYNSLEIYPHMNEKCPSLAPTYVGPKGC